MSRCIDIKYGVKMEALALLQEWVATIGSQAGLTDANAAIYSGAVGVPESRLEVSSCIHADHAHLLLDHKLPDMRMHAECMACTAYS